jgi:alkylation response protein AidB-like acyl-CoA dehydrogenase
MVDFADTTEQAVWRAEVRQFVEDHLPRELADDQLYAGTLGGMHRGPLGKRRADLLKQWRKAILDRGWIAPAWPKEVGGADMSPVEQFILREVFTELHAPIMSVHDVGSTILVHGSEEQKQKYLPPMVRGEIQWCQGYSEPGAGSDLASIRTRAVVDDGHFVVNGQKIWTSSAHYADMMFLLCRTEPDRPKHAGLSYLLVPMTTPGIEVRPLVTMTGRAEFNEVFFTDVRVPGDQIVMGRGDGWHVANLTLKHERLMLGDPSKLGHRVERIAELMARAGVDGERLMDRPELRDRLLRLQAEVLASRCHHLRLLTQRARGEDPGLAQTIVKYFGTTLGHRLSALAVDVLGVGGLAYEPRGEAAEDDEATTWQIDYMYDVGLMIGGGTSQIQKNIIAERGLGLPREPRAAAAGRS